MRNIRFLKLSLFIIGFFITTICNGQNSLKNLIVQDLLQNDSIVNLVLINFECQNIDELSKVVLGFGNSQTGQNDSQELSILHKDSKSYIKLINGEEIELFKPLIAFATPVPKPSAMPYSVLTINGILINGNSTNVLTHNRQY